MEITKTEGLYLVLPMITTFLSLSVDEFHISRQTFCTLFFFVCFLHEPQLRISIFHCSNLRERAGVRVCLRERESPWILLSIMM